MSCGPCGRQAGDTMQSDTGVPAGAPTSAARARCPHCQAFIVLDGAACANPRCPRHLAQRALTVARAAGPTVETRALACRYPQGAYLYARDVDQGPRDDTRAAACGEPALAYAYALDVDQSPRADTRGVACQEAAWAYCYAFEVDKTPRDDTRRACLPDPFWTYCYALVMDRAPRDDTRQAVAPNPEMAAAYSQWEHTHGPPGGAP